MIFALAGLPYRNWGGQLLNVCHIDDNLAVAVDNTIDRIIEVPSLVGSPSLSLVY